MNPKTFFCEHCGAKGIKEIEVFTLPTNLIVPGEALFHKVISSVPGGGFRDCGPCTEEKPA